MILLSVFASGRGTNLRALLGYFKLNSEFKISLLITDNSNAECIQIAQAENIPVYYADYSNGKSYAENGIISKLKENHINAVVLAGFMRIISGELINAVGLPIFNIHPSLLPRFKGINSIERAYNSEDIETGITVHLIDESVDEGTVICQHSITINRDEPLEELEKSIHELEHAIYPKTVESVCRKIFNKE